MSGTGQVISTGLRNRPDDTRLLLAVLTDGRDVNTGFDSLYLDPDGPVPPNGVTIAWTLRHAEWTLPSGEVVHAHKRGLTYDSGITRP